MVHHDIHYLIYPKNNLIDLLSNKYINFIPTTQRSTLWKIGEGGYGRPIRSERTIGIKLLFLSQLRSDIIDIEPDNCHEFLETLMGKPPFSAAIFDRWWDID